MVESFRRRDATRPHARRADVENPEAATVTGTDQENGELFIETRSMRAISARSSVDRVASSRRSARSLARRGFARWLPCRGRTRRVVRMSCTEYELVARVGRPAGLWEVTATTAGNLPFSVYEGCMSMWSHPPWMVRANSMFSSVCEGAGNTYQLRFDGVDSIDAAEQIAGRFLSPTCAIWRISIIPCAISVAGSSTNVMASSARSARSSRRRPMTCGSSTVLMARYSSVVDEVIVAYPDDDDGVIRTRVMDGLLES